MGSHTQEVETRQGRVLGTRGEHQASFLGIPYARPPVGLLRFAAPQPPEPWPGVRDCTRFAASCPQPEHHPVAGFAASGARDEDCLFLNVYTPAADAARRPVMVWVHGGGFVFGSGSEPLYDGAALTTRGDVVVVSVHYRLGALGFLQLGLHGGDELGATDNAGLRDQVAALRWVRENIGAFGGDADNVTLFGESAGAACITAVMVMPAAEGLFRRVVSQSGTANRLGNADSGEKATGRVLTHLGLGRDDLARLWELPVASLVDAQEATGARCLPVWGVESMPQRPLEYVRAGRAAGVELLIGTNRDEAKLLVAPNRPAIDDATLRKQVATMLPRRASERVGDVIDAYRRSRAAHDLPGDNLSLLDAIQGDGQFRTGARKLAVAQREHQPRTFLYLFTWESPARRGTLGACHALDIPFVFGATDQPLQRRFAGAGPAATALSHRMMDAWIAFARSGDPAHADLGEWPAYDNARQVTMVFGERSGAVAAPLGEEAAIWDDVLSA